MSVLMNASQRLAGRRRVLKGMVKGAAVTVGLPYLDCFLDVNGARAATVRASGAGGSHPGHMFSANPTMTDGKHQVCVVGVNRVYGSGNTTLIPHSYTQYSANFAATVASTNLTFAFREDPAFLLLSNVVLHTDPPLVDDDHRFLEPDLAEPDEFVAVETPTTELARVAAVMPSTIEQANARFQIAFESAPTGMAI